MLEYEKQPCVVFLEEADRSICESVKALQYASRMRAKMDKATVQAGYQLSPYVKTADNKLFLARVIEAIRAVKYAPGHSVHRLDS